MASRKKKKLIKRRLQFIAAWSVVVIAVVGVCGAIVAIVKGLDANEKTTGKKGNITQSSKDHKPKTDKGPHTKYNKIVELEERGGYMLDANYTRLLLVNGENPLPEDYDYGWNLATIPQKYIKGSLTKIDAGVLPYMLAMLDAARVDGVDLGVWSPYRDYSTQKMLFDKQVNRVGGDEDLASTVVARPGTSEHNTALCSDFNMANDAFENTKAYEWMMENAEDYGFILRYTAEKKPLTNVIHESWHWRFVGINAAREINKKGYCLEEYIEYLEENTDFKRNTDIYEYGISESTKIG